MKRPGIGAVVGRFQVHDLHEGHRALIDEANKHARLVVFIGISPYLVTPNDPLDFAAREQMVKALYPNAVVSPLADMPTDAGWSAAIDSRLAEVFPLDKPTLYFGRGSSRSKYSGRLPTSEIDAIALHSGTDIRTAVGKQVQDSADFRAGVIYAAHNMWQRAVPAVDIAITRKAAIGYEVLLGQRSNEGGQYRFPGGHVDIRDESSEVAARREAQEETGVEIGTLQYIGSFRVKSGSHWAMFTNFYAAPYVFGSATASDDIDRVEWMPLHKLSSLPFADAHAALANALLNFIDRTGDTVK
jgi:bifunctional NMN adenylyltransferase/nudix hydrolase